MAYSIEPQRDVSKDGPQLPGPTPEPRYEKCAEHEAEAFAIFDGIRPNRPKLVHYALSRAAARNWIAKR